jgi:hypothetical protein
MACKAALPKRAATEPQEKSLQKCMAISARFTAVTTAIFLWALMATSPLHA